MPSRVVLDTLHLFLAAGHADAVTAARLDPPTSYFRIRCHPLPVPLLHLTDNVYHCWDRAKD